MDEYTHFISIRLSEAEYQEQLIRAKQADHDDLEVYAGEFGQSDVRFHGVF